MRRSHNKKNKSPPEPPPPLHEINKRAAAAAAAAPATIGILSFEVAAVMSRAVHLHRSLADSEITRLRTHTLSSAAELAVVSSDPRHLLALALAEKLDDLNRVAASAAQLGRRCSHPALLGFDHVYADLLARRIPSSSSPDLFLSKDIEPAIRRMDRLVSSTSALYTHLDSLADLEHSAAKFSDDTTTRRNLDQKIHWHRHDVKLLRDASLWNQSYDKVVLLLARAVCSIHARIRHVFREAVLGLDSLVPGPTPLSSRRIAATPCRSIQLHTGPIQSDAIKSGRINKSPETEPRVGCNFHRTSGLLRLHNGTSPGRLFMECLSLGSSASFHNKYDDDDDDESCLGALVPFSRTLRFGPKSRLTSLALPSTIGGSGLALHYANLIIIIEKLRRYPHLVGEEARDDLYQMLPSSLRTALKRSLKSYVKNLAIYDASLAHDWKEAMDKILSWLAPMAHNMIQWQTDRNFEQQQIVSRANVLLLETLYFADREKAESAICELLVGLNYLCRYEQQQNALLDCTSSIDFDDCMSWKMKY